jgi:hypothetical protein
VGLAYDAMPAASGWQARLSADLEHYGQAVTESLAWVPGWAAAVALLVVVTLLAWRALGQMSQDGSEETKKPEGKQEKKEGETLEYRDA